LTLRIRQAESAADIVAVRDLFLEYVSALGIDLAFQDFAAEIAGLPGRYAPPDGRLLLAWWDDQVAGCIALRRLSAEVAEMKRLYVRPEFRGAAVDRALAEAVIAEARSIRYRRIRLDTLPSMSAARGLYRSLGFREIEPYAANPVPGTAFLELVLR
jgi:ribosomal protein S18 acetylase RimI-like enzyme